MRICDNERLTAELDRMTSVLTLLTSTNEKMQVMSSDLADVLPSYCCGKAISDSHLQ